jgi:hypothetical protein
MVYLNQKNNILNKNYFAKEFALLISYKKKCIIDSII